MITFGNVIADFSSPRDATPVALEVRCGEGAATSTRGRVRSPETPVALRFAVGALTNIRAFAGKATLSEPWEVAAHVSYSFKPKWLNRLGANVCDGLFDRIRCENQL
jgi:hypothetical protein